MLKNTLKSSLGFTVLIALTACSNVANDVVTVQKSESVKTFDLITNDRSKLGTIELTDSGGHVGLVVSLSGIAPGAHGIHFHSVADCSDDKFLNTKGHINPMGKMHGLNHAQGPDNADLPNLIVAKDGTANQTFKTPRLSFHGDGEERPALFDADGSAIVIHANEDDQNTQPIGGAGGRLVCAEIK